MRLHNTIGYKPNYFSIVYAPLRNLIPQAVYILSFQAKGATADNRKLVGISSDKWGNKSFSYSSRESTAEWQKVQMQFKAPISGNINLIIRNAASTKELLIDNIRLAQEK